MKRTLIHNATIVNEGQSVQGSVVIENGRIAEVLTNWKPLSAPCEEVIDATGCYLLPGIIDDHVHFRDPGLTHKADILTESRAAAAGGVTSIMDMPNTNPLTVTLDALNAKLDLLNEKCIVNHSCYFGATNNNYTEFDKLDKHRVCGIKLFMGSSTGNMLVDKMNSLLNIFNGTDMLIAAHCEDDRYFMDKVVDHLLVFNGQGDIRDFPGNYTQYRDWKDVKAAQEKEKEKEAAKTQEEKTAKVRLNEKRRMSFKEKREFEQLEQEIAALEAEKQSIEEALCSGALSVEELTEKSKRLPELTDLIDEKTMRWLELSEIESN